MSLTVWPAERPLVGRYRPPGDKSVTHRALIFGALAGGETRIEGFLEAGDTLATLAAVAALGVKHEREADAVRIRGGDLTAPSGTLDLGNSGTGIRLLTGALAGRRDLAGASIELAGDASLSRRPMERIIRPLSSMGAHIESRDGHAPLIVHPRILDGRRIVLPVASAQVKSALLLAGLAARGETVVVEPAPTRDHTERLLPVFGAIIEDGRPGLALPGGQILTGARVRVPGDLSAAAYAMAAAALVEGSEVMLDGVGLNPTRDGFVRILRAMGADPEIETGSGQDVEPTGTLRARHARLSGIDIPAAWVPLAIDELPVVMALAAAAEGASSIRGASELRLKESDRLAVMCRELARLGVKVEESGDGARIFGGPVHAGEVDAAGDHRVAMSLAVLALVADGPVVIHEAEWIHTSYPAFTTDMGSLGARMEWT